MVHCLLSDENCRTVGAWRVRELVSVDAHTHVHARTQTHTVSEVWVEETRVVFLLGFSLRVLLLLLLGSSPTGAYSQLKTVRERKKEFEKFIHTDSFFKFWLPSHLCLLVHFSEFSASCIWPDFLIVFSGTERLQGARSILPITRNPANAVTTTYSRKDILHWARYTDTNMSNISQYFLHYVRWPLTCLVIFLVS